MKLGRYRHFKGNQYIVVGFARCSETEQEMVIYQQDYDNHGYWVRPKAMFIEKVELNGEKVPRFEFLTSDTEMPADNSEAIFTTYSLPELNPVTNQNNTAESKNTK